MSGESPVDRFPLKIVGVAYLARQDLIVLSCIVKSCASGSRAEEGRLGPEANDTLAYRQEDPRKTVIAHSAQSQRALGIKRCEINGAGPAIDDQFGHG